MCYDSGVKCAYRLREQFGKQQQPKEDESGENPGSCSVSTKLRKSEGKEIVA